ncbi:hypothetical protein BDN71DRAFT_1501834 [Pleurotus eryngii]|uniref:Uncharacterized protein n=1 Tax=Pleurotus eryngii TaxID=5323 RepID=A0A9P6DKE9_PLEER|nr:hypothetical protein BDN71DRAFT_1501834 [Pleurotus eryngii]
MLPLELITKVVAFLDDPPRSKEEWENDSWPDRNNRRRISPSLFACSLSATGIRSSTHLLSFISQHLSSAHSFSNFVCPSTQRLERQFQDGWAPASGITSLLASTSLTRLTLMGWDRGNNVSDLRLISSACSASLGHLTITRYNHRGIDSRRPSGRMFESSS